MLLVNKRISSKNGNKMTRKFESICHTDYNFNGIVFESGKVYKIIDNNKNYLYNRTENILFGSNIDIYIENRYLRGFNSGIYEFIYTFEQMRDLKLEKILNEKS